MKNRLPLLRKQLPAHSIASFSASAFTAVLVLPLVLVCCQSPSTVPYSPEPEPDGDRAVKVAGVSLDRRTLTLEVGDGATLAVGLFPQDAANRNVSWSSNRPDIATVDAATGEIAALAFGVAVVAVATEDGNFTKTCEVRVVADDSDDSDSPDDPDDPDDSGDPDPDDPESDDPAPDEPEYADGKIGSLDWEFAEGTLTIVGNGEVPDFEVSDNDEANRPPWHGLRGRIEKVVIGGEGIARIGDNAFAGCSAIRDVVVAKKMPPGLGGGNFTVVGDTLLVPAGCAVAYRGNLQWRAAFETIVEQ